MNLIPVLSLHMSPIKVSLRNGKNFTDLYLYYLFTVINICLLIHITLKSQLSSARLCVQVQESWFRKRDYPEDLISSEMGKVRFSNLKLKSVDKNHNMNSISLVVSHHFLLKSISAIIVRNFLFCIWIKM